jgi:Type II secretion system (T2SS), protein E, N-terminal domain
MTAPPSPALAAGAAPASVPGLTPPTRRPGPKPRLGDMIVQHQAVPIAFADRRTLLVALADLANVLALDDIRIAPASRRVAEVLRVTGSLA